MSRCYHCDFGDRVTGGCNYFLATGRRRTGPVEDCDCFEERKSKRSWMQYKKKAPGPKPSNEKIRHRNAAMMELYNEGLSDIAIAAELGCAPVTVRQWRWSIGLPSQLERKKKEVKNGN
jgi:hypothetical protein